MKTVVIDKPFASMEECRAWEDENLDTIAKTHGGVILAVMHEDTGKGAVTLTEVILV